MTNIAQITVSKAVVAFVTAAMIFSAFVVPAKAQTITMDQLLAQIAQLQAQIAALQGGSTQLTTGGNCAAIPAPLTMGSTGANVTALQNYLISSGESIPAGATGFFGSQTKAALASWQSKNGVSPAVGYYGPITAAAMAAKCTPVGPGPVTPTEPTEPTTPTTPSLQGEASFKSADLKDADETDIEEGARDAVIGILEVEFEDGDARIDRLDVALSRIGTGGQQSPWETFSTVSIWVNGERVASRNASSRSDYLDRNAGSLRFSGLNIVVEEDKEIEILIAATVNNAVRNINVAGDTWKLEVIGMRFFDATGVAETLNQIDLGLSGDSARFTVETAGAQDEVRVRVNSSDPAAATLKVEDDRRSGAFTIFRFDLDATKSANDLIFDEIKVFVDLSTSTYNARISSPELVVGGRTYSSPQVSGGTTQNATLAFDIDERLKVRKGERVTAELRVRFEQLPAALEGMEVRGRMVGNDTNISVRGAQDLSGSQISGTAIGQFHTLTTSDVEITGYTWTPAPNGSFLDFTFSVTANDGDFDVLLSSFTHATTVGGGATTSAPVLTRTSAADTATAITGGFKVLDGKTATFRIRFSINGPNGGTLDVTATSLAGRSIPKDKEVSPTVSRNVSS
jgi:peptidoglycan hydrolase-like protein with peptidoglycan-binding domain